MYSKSELTKSLILKDFTSFARYAIPRLGKQILFWPYMLLICAALQCLADGHRKKLIINLPPRHLKTTLCSVLLAAWELGRFPDKEILVVTCSEGLAREIASGVRIILESDWYRKLFPGTKIQVGRRTLLDFKTTAGGGLFATPIGAAIVGRGADLIIMDDVVDFRDADDEEALAEINQFVDTYVMSRLNNREDGRVLIVAHRLHENDLSGHLLARGGYAHLALPLIAEEDETYPWDGRSYHRRKGEFLRPDAYTDEIAEELRSTNTNFEWLYQQGLAAAGGKRIRPEDFQLIDAAAWPEPTYVLSIDPGHTEGGRSSTCIQAWAVSGDRSCLVGQWSDNAGLENVHSILSQYLNHSRPCVVLVERTGFGEALRRRYPRWRFEWVIPRESKSVRFQRHREAILAGRICLQDGAQLVSALLDQVARFPRGETDAVDALSQFADWWEEHPDLPSRPASRTLGCVVTGRQVREANDPMSPAFRGWANAGPVPGLESRVITQVSPGQRPLKATVISFPPRRPPGF